MVTFSQLLQQITPGVTISLKEYAYIRNKRRLTLSIDNSLVHDVIPANVSIGREQLEQYYGNDLDDVDYLQLSTVNCLRVILLVRVDESNHPVYKPILINQDFYESGLQEVEIISGNFPEEPVYAPQMLGQLPENRSMLPQESEPYEQTHLHFPPY